MSFQHPAPIFFIRTALKGGWEIKLLVLNVEKDAKEANFEEFTYQMRVRIIIIRLNHMLHPKPGFLGTVL